MPLQTRSYPTLNSTEGGRETIRTGLAHSPANLPRLQNDDDTSLKVVSLLKHDIMILESDTEQRNGIIPASGQRITLCEHVEYVDGPLGSQIKYHRYDGLVLPEDFDPENTLYLVSSKTLRRLIGYSLERGITLGHFGRPAGPIHDASGKVVGYSCISIGLGGVLSPVTTCTAPDCDNSAA